jgi:hypothetical protein
VLETTKEKRRELLNLALIIFENILFCFVVVIHLFSFFKKTENQLTKMPDKNLIEKNTVFKENDCS